MGLSLKKLGKKIGKALKKGAKIVKKIAPVALALTGVGGAVGAVATKAVQAVSKAKSKGVNVAKLTPVAAVTKVSRAVQGKPAKRSSTGGVTTSPRTTSRTPKAPSIARLKRLYAEWKESDQALTWEEYANEALNP